MINRTLIRIKVIQLLYSYELNKSTQTLEQAKKDLKTSLDKSHELYFALLQLMIDLTNLQERRLDEAKHKFLPTEEDLNPNMRFVENELINWLCENEEIQQFVGKHKITWWDDEIFLRLMLDKVLYSDDYKEYMSMEATDFASDCHVWHQLLKKVILPDEDLEETLESKSVYLNPDDLDIIGQFVLKTIKRIENLGASKNADTDDEIHTFNPIYPQYKDEEDSRFAEELFESTILQMQENNMLIDLSVKSDRWDADRIALMDRIIMCTAITELKQFEKIPTVVTLNEYIEMAKSFSTARSGQFVNGILNSVTERLKKEKVINKY
ncbi:MAG: transcription antitermination protein NusB [Muribaculaceae bacterium]|nr:transcription antitermination protein NusB [Muribaculaceae bacterium]